MTLTIVVGTRGSPLASAQTRSVVDLMKRKSRGMSIKFVIKPIRTVGDDMYREAKHKLTGKEIFTGAIDQALEGGEIDLAVHSLKDVPVENYPKKKIELCAFPKRGPPNDAMISRKRNQTLESLPAGAQIGTSSLRRALQLKSYRPDFKIIEIHGNVETRVRKLRQGSNLDAVVLAEAGLDRLLMKNEVDEVLSTEVMLPAPGQGCLAIAIRSDDSKTRGIVSRIDDENSKIAAVAERAFSKQLGGGCNVPIAALATINENDNSLLLEGLVANQLSGSSFIVRDSIQGTAEEAEVLGERLAEQLKDLSR